jgi:ketosteroid isomerase-like protein
MTSADMIGHFLRYAQAFEQTYADDDWSRLDEFLAPDVVYRVLGTDGWDCVVEGRQAVYAAIRKFLDGFDRHCTRRVSPGSAPPSVEGDCLRVTGSATYRRGDSDELVLDMELMAEFRDGAIVALSDVYPVATVRRMTPWMARFGQGLDPSYV